MTRKFFEDESFNINESQFNLAFNTNVTANLILKLLMELRAKQGDKSLEEVEALIADWYQKQLTISKELLVKSA